ncbi:hypothetical protein [Metamycoplasma auris]|uniref:Uncharacterized protein n=1 Tax=Metamycoplasma auris TaxID=51363 RepID=A0A2W7G1L0_9BACT|nr:hypothetical protein [Metamycoplasma auris]PZW00580.1 hypothetical protein BCF89_10339 [Metamycoplasma auris]
MSPTQPETTEEGTTRSDEPQADSPETSMNELPKDLPSIHSENEELFNKIKKYIKEKNEIWNNKQGRFGHTFENTIMKDGNLFTYSLSLFSLGAQIKDSDSYTEYKTKNSYDESRARKDNSIWKDIVTKYESIKESYTSKLKDFVSKLKR